MQTTQPLKPRPAGAVRVSLPRSLRFPRPGPRFTSARDGAVSESLVFLFGWREMIARWARWIDRNENEGVFLLSQDRDRWKVSKSRRKATCGVRIGLWGGRRTRRMMFDVDQDIRIFVYLQSGSFRCTGQNHSLRSAACWRRSARIARTGVAASSVWPLGWPGWVVELDFVRCVPV
jgi:hypothetical protein